MLFWSVKYSLIELLLWTLVILYILLLNMYIPSFKSLPDLFLKIYSLKCFFMKKWPKSHTILVCKLYIYIAMDLKLGMLVHIITQHVLYTFKSQSHCIVKISSILSLFTIKNDQNIAHSGL